MSFQIPGITHDRTSVQNILFAATQVPSSNANALDDYEEGSWTPALGGSGGQSITFTAQQGWYVKVGKLVHVNCRIAVDTKTSITGNAQIQGLPFTVSNSGNDEGVGIMIWNNLGSNKVIVVALTDENATTAGLFAAAAAAADLSAVVNADIAANSTILQTSFTYRATN